MKIVYFTHSLLSCWNHGNAHFLRGVLSELARLGHNVVAYEPTQSWSRDNLLREPDGAAVPDMVRRLHPDLTLRFHDDTPPAEDLGDADLVIVHEWNQPRLVAALGDLRKRDGRFTLLFHDTHHRAVSDPQAIRHFDLDAYDGVLAFGATLAEVYRGWGWGDRAFVWHEAADVRRFHPPADERDRCGLVWIGNWGDGERGEELERFLLRPARDAGLPLTIHGVRYPADALAMLARYGAVHRGWLANPRAPAVFARHLATVHVPRRCYTQILPGIPTIRVFEALACGVPLVSAPWDDTEGLFHPGTDYLVAADGDAMVRHLTALRHDAELRRALVDNGLATIRARHTCAHRAQELLTIAGRLATPASMEIAR